MKTQIFNAKKMAYCAAGAAILGVSSWITIQLGDLVFTMQSFAVFLLLAIFGGKIGSLSILIWLLLGAVGVPVFSSFRGGMGVLLGVTGGYIWGFLIVGPLYGAITTRFPRGKLPAMVLGMLVCYTCGTLWFLIAYAGDNAMSFWAVAAKCVVPYIIPDAIKLTLAWKLSTKIKKTVDKL